MRSTVTILAIRMAACAVAWMMASCWLTSAVECGENPVPLVEPWERVKSQTHSSITSDLEVLEGTFEVKTRVAQVPSVTCTYLIPLSRPGRPYSTASEVVLRFGWIGQNPLAKGEVSRALATKFGFTIISLQWPQQAGVDVNDRTKFSVYAESGSGEAWMYALAKTRFLGRLDNRKPYVLGFSAGASAAHQFAEAYPDSVDGAVCIAGRTFSKEPKCHAPYLIMHSTKDRVAENAELLYGLQQHGSIASVLSFAPDWRNRGSGDLWMHTSAGVSWAMAHAWLANLADLRERNAGITPPAAMWHKFDGMLMPGKDCQPFIQELNGTAKWVEDVPLGTRALILANPNTKADGKTVWRLDRRFAIDDDELLAPGELLSGRGYRCAAVGSDSDALTDSIMQIFTRSKSSPPITMVVVAPRPSDFDALARIQGKVSSFLFIDPSPRVLEKNWNKISSFNQKYTLFISDNISKEISPEVKASKKIKIVAHPEFSTSGARYAAELECTLQTADR